MDKEWDKRQFLQDAVLAMLYNRGLGSRRDVYGMVIHAEELYNKIESRVGQTQEKSSGSNPEV